LLVDLIDEVLETVESPRQSFLPPRMQVVSLDYDWEPEQYMMGTSQRWKCDILTSNTIKVLKCIHSPEPMEYDPTNLCAAFI